VAALRQAAGSDEAYATFAVPECFELPELEVLGDELPQPAAASPRQAIAMNAPILCAALMNEDHHLTDDS